VNERIRRQHTVSKFYLRGFADDEANVRRLQILDRKSVTLSITNASVIKDFYTITLPDGSQSDVFERAFSEVEGGAAEALRSVLDGCWPLFGDAREYLATWIALQHLRGEEIRSSQGTINAELIRLIVGVSGKEALRKRIEAAEERRVTDAELNREWADITKPGGPDLEPNILQHIDTIISLVGGTAAYLRDSHWTLFKFKRRALLTSDHPVSLVTDTDHPAWREVGIATAALFLVPLSRRAALTIQPRWRFEKFGYPPIDVDKVPDIQQAGTTQIALSVNQETAWRARRYIYHHPLDDPLGRLSLPDVEPDRRPQFSSSIDNMIREEGLFHGLSDQNRKLLSAMHSESESGRGMTINDLPWPIPGRRPLT
jgi:hypothetical protein